MNVVDPVGLPVGGHKMTKLTRDSYSTGELSLVEPPSVKHAKVRVHVCARECVPMTVFVSSLFRILQIYLPLLSYLSFKPVGNTSSQAGSSDHDQASEGSFFKCFDSYVHLN